ncbi:hypothetical protein ACF0H5_001828 [Mactra antiquata]
MVGQACVKNAGILLLMLTIDGCIAQRFVNSAIKKTTACATPDHCQTNFYSLQCSAVEKVAVWGVNYGAKPYTSYCPNSQTCLSKTRCCGHEPADCVVPMNDTELVNIFTQCSQTIQCGWLFATSIDIKDKCKIRDRSNYVQTYYQCISDYSFIDICSEHTVTAKSVHIHHSAILRGMYNYNQCSCLITPDVCNTTAKLTFRSVDVRLHSLNNLTKCTTQSRVELIGQNERKVYGCETNKFLHGFETFHVSNENNIMLYLHKKPRVFPTKIWLEVEASSPDVNVRVTCSPRSTVTAKRCPAMPIKQTDNVDDVEDLPEKEDTEPTIIHLDPDDLDPDLDVPEDAPKDKQSPAMAAVIGGIIAGVVVLILMLIVLLLYMRKRRKHKSRKSLPSSKECSPYKDEPQQVNYYEAINDKIFIPSDGAGNNVIYHQPWGDQPGISVNNRAKPSDLAYATSEEIKVLIEKMEKDRHTIIEGEQDHYSEPDPTYYRHISTFSFKPPAGNDNIDGTSGSVVNKRQESETESVASENCGTEKLESEDSKVEADRAIDSDVESHKVESETVSTYFDGYESPRVSSFQPSDTTSVRTSVRSSLKSDNPAELHNYVYQPETVILEDGHSDSDVPDEHAPPVSDAVKNRNQSESTDEDGDDDSVFKLGGYTQPKGSKEVLNIDTDSDEDTTSDHPYSPVYDEIKDQHTKL